MNNTFGAPAQTPMVARVSLQADLVRMLKFTELLETEYRYLHLTQFRTRVRFWQSLLVAVGLVYGIDHLITDAASDAYKVESVLRFAVLLPMSCTLTWIAWSSLYDQLYWRVARLLVPLGALITAALMALLVARGQGEALSGLEVHMLGIMFLSGLLFRHAVFTCSLMIVTFFIIVLPAGSSASKLFFDAITPLTTVGIAGFVCYQIEKLARKTFLEQRRTVEEASSDALTGLRNRRAFDEYLPRVWKHAVRESGYLCLLLIDVDDFKRYNDRYGHQAGDKCLQQIASVVQRFAQRPLDLAARIGGEELAVILFDIKPAQVEHMAEELRKTIEQLSIEHLDAQAVPVVTISVGVACIKPLHKRSFSGLVQLADEALYEAKSKGRNQIVMKTQEYRFLSTGMFRRPSPDSTSPGP